MQKALNSFWARGLINCLTGAFCIHTAQCDWYTYPLIAHWTQDIFTSSKKKPLHQNKKKPKMKSSLNFQHQKARRRGGGETEKERSAENGWNL